MMAFSFQQAGVTELARSVVSFTAGVPHLFTIMSVSPLLKETDLMLIPHTYSTNALHSTCSFPHLTVELMLFLSSFLLTAYVAIMHL